MRAGKNMLLFSTKATQQDDVQNHQPQETVEISGKGLVVPCVNFSLINKTHPQTDHSLYLASCLLKYCTVSHATVIILDLFFYKLEIRLSTTSTHVRTLSTCIRVQTGSSGSRGGRCM